MVQTMQIVLKKCTIVGININSSASAVVLLLVVLVVVVAIFPARQPGTGYVFSFVVSFRVTVSFRVNLTLI